MSACGLGKLRCWPMKPSSSNTLSQHRSRRRAARRTLGVATSVVLSAGLFAACGDDAEESFCQAGDDLSSSISGLADVDLISDGTSALEDQVAEINSNIDQLRDSGAEVASAEIDALDDAVEQLGTALRDLGGGVSTDDAQAAVAAVGSVTTAANGVFDKLSNACD